MNAHSRLVKRNMTYYFRARIPICLVYLAKHTQFCYSLKTHNYYEAVAKLRRESYKVDMKINLLRSLDMKIKNGELLLDDTDIDKLVINKLKTIEKVFEDHYDEIAEGNYNLEPLKVFNHDLKNKVNRQLEQSNQTNTNYELKCVEVFIKEYFDGLKRDKRTPFQTMKLIGRLDNDDIKIIANPAKPHQWVADMNNVLKGIDKYVDKNAIAIQNGEDVSGINQRVRRCIKAIELEKNQKAISSSNTQTSWKRIFKDFAQKKKNEKVSQNHINECEFYLETIFTILNKQFVENITYQDCYKLTDLIYKLPKRWKYKYKPDELRKVLETETTNRISATTITKCLRVFKEFLLFCKKRRFIQESFNDEVELPKRKDSIRVDGFSRDELRIIFNPSNYPSPHNIYHGYRYWIPLIALFSGMRANEICQLYVDDVKYIDKIWCFDLTDEREDQHLKNKQSKRIIPVHPKLIELGFIDYVKSIRKAKKNRLFYQLTYTTKNHYTHAISIWFARYLQSLYIESRSKVFHSFRHLVKQTLRDCGVSQEYQNAICGWRGRDIGEQIYSGPVPAKILYQELSKLEYPFLNKNFDELKRLYKKE